MVTPNEIIRLRQDLRWSRSKLARSLGVSSTTVFHWENGACNADLYKQAALLQIRRRLDSAQSMEQRDEFKRALSCLYRTQGLLALLTFLFQEPE